MPTHVYANNNEIASKASEGKSIAAFPDVCFSPPAPPVGPMPLPYPNTGECSNTDEGTSKVFIKDKMSGMAGDSCFSKSMGDESATKNFTKGMITSALQGKCYFGLWSMDVQMEGKGVPRHLDMVTHNHASMMGQIPGADTDNFALPNEVKRKQDSNKDSDSCSLVAIDIYRPQKDSNSKFRSGNVHKNEVLGILGDTELISDDYLIQYVNIKSTFACDVKLPEHTRYYEGSVLRSVPSNAQFGSHIKIRVRFSEKKSNAFKLKFEKKGPKYSNTEITANSKIDGILCKVDGKEVYDVSYNDTYETNDDGWKEIDISLDMTTSEYILTATHEKKKVVLRIFSRKKIFMNVYYPNYFKNSDISYVNMAVRDCTSLYFEVGVDLEIKNTNSYSEPLIYNYPPEISGSNYAGVLNVIKDDHRNLYDSTATFLVNDEYSMGCTVDVVVVKYVYFTEKRMESFGEVTGESFKKNTIEDLKDYEFVKTMKLDKIKLLNSNITSMKSITSLIVMGTKIVGTDVTDTKVVDTEVTDTEVTDTEVTDTEVVDTVSNINFVFDSCGKSSIMCNEKQLSIFIDIKSETTALFYINANLHNYIKARNKCSFVCTAIGGRYAAGFSMTNQVKTVCAGYYIKKMNEDYENPFNLNNKTAHLHNIIVHEIAHRFGIVKYQSLKDFGLITLDRRSDSDGSGGILSSHCTDGTCIMYDSLYFDDFNAKSFCKSCTSDLKKSDLRLNLPKIPDYTVKLSL